MLRFELSSERWWNKPLVEFNGQTQPAELAVLASVLRPDERGVWLNSRGKLTGVGGFTRRANGTYQTSRLQLPPFVAQALSELYQESGLARGCPDLVIWNTANETLRLVEVKCPHWDRPSRQQDEFMRVAARLGIPTSVAEWEFRPAPNGGVLNNEPTSS